MRNRFSAAMTAVTAILAVGLLASAPASGQASTVVAKTKTVAVAKTGLRTADGQPDLQGTWNYSTMTPLERPRDLAGKEFFTEPEVADYEKSLLTNINRDRRDGGAQADLNRAYNEGWYDSGSHIVKTRRTSLVIDPPDGRIPALTPEAQKREEARAEDRRRRGGDPADSWEDRSLGERCLTRGAPKLPGGYNNNVQIVQAPGYVAMFQEMIHEVRMIPVDGRPHLAKNIRQWLGDSVGHWEGNTLVVDTTNYTGKIVSNAFNCCRGAGANLHVIERFTRVDADTLDYQYTVDDPSTYTKPWTVSLPMTKTDDPLYEYACHEGNYGMTNLLSGARAQERAAAEAKK
ncbi:MAG TPA: hypothetical protein VGR73_14260 [Bryobacteraceae bacterium]|nr:hypothetical protein [Bryobacteraceae bacterium]